MCFNRKSDVGKIYKTTDGYFSGRSDIKKPRHIAVIHQRKDKAVAVVKLYGKKEKKGKSYIDNIVLTPKKHKSLKEDTIVGNSLIYGRNFDKTKYALFPNEFEYTQDKLSFIEYLKIKNKVNADTRQHKKTRNNTIKKWKNFFRK